MLLFSLSEFVKLFRRLLEYNYLRCLTADIDACEYACMSSAFECVSKRCFSLEHVDVRMQKYMELMLLAIDSKEYEATC